MIDPRSTKYQLLPKLEILLQSGCNDNEKCQCELSGTYSSTSEESFSIVVGANQMILVMNFVIKNDGTEPGYKAKVGFVTRGGIELPNPNENENCFNDSPESGMVVLNI